MADDFRSYAQREADNSMRYLAQLNEANAEIVSLRARLAQAQAELAQARKNAGIDADIWAEQLGRKHAEWASEYDRAHVATYQAERWKAEAERLAAMGRAVQTDRDEQRIRADAAEAALARVTKLCESATLTVPGEFDGVLVVPVHEVEAAVRAALVVADTPQAKAHQDEKADS